MIAPQPAHDPIQGHPMSPPRSCTAPRQLSAMAAYRGNTLAACTGGLINDWIGSP